MISTPDRSSARRQRLTNPAGRVGRLLVPEQHAVRVEKDAIQVSAKAIKELPDGHLQRAGDGAERGRPDPGLTGLAQPVPLEPLLDRYVLVRPDAGQVERKCPGHLREIGQRTVGQQRIQPFGLEVVPRRRSGPASACQSAGTARARNGSWTGRPCRNSRPGSGRPRPAASPTARPVPARPRTAARDVRHARAGAQPSCRWAHRRRLRRPWSDQGRPIRR